MNTAQKAVILVDGVPVVGASQIIPSAQSFEIATDPATGHSYVVADTADPAANVTVRKGGREGVFAFSIVDAPLDVSLGTPEPK